MLTFILFISQTTTKERNNTIHLAQCHEIDSQHYYECYNNNIEVVLLILHRNTCSGQNTVNNQGSTADSSRIS